jgi:hypothetical protein
LKRREPRKRYRYQGDENSEDQDVGEWIILKWILEIYDGVVWTGLIWFWIQTSGGLF